ncbi:MAG: hypothetical protein HQM15_06980 [Deltaproteobacteria bacterium]|nr:hypothetical protein [Deltaproteobacteria bacterium]
MILADKAADFLMGINTLNEEDYTALIQSKIDPELLAVFQEYCLELVPEEDESVVSTLLHLMIMGYLVKENEKNPLTKSKIELSDLN